MLPLPSHSGPFAGGLACVPCKKVSRYREHWEHSKPRETVNFVNFSSKISCSKEPGSLFALGPLG